MTDALTAEYRRFRGWDAEPGPTSRISCELPRNLIHRLNRQARLTGIGRGEIIRAAVEGMVRDFERIDSEKGTVCPVCQHHLSIHGKDGCQVSTCDCIYSEGEDRCPIVTVNGGNLTDRLLDPQRRDGIQIPVFIIRQQKVETAWDMCPRCAGSGEVTVADTDLIGLEYADEIEEARRCPRCGGAGRTATEWGEVPQAGMLRRQCTERFKSRPIYKWLNQWREGSPVTLAIGISWDEVQRMHDPQRKWVTNEYPLVERRLDRWAYLRWLTEAGWSAPRSACVYCPFHNNDEWRRLRDEQPDDWAEAVRVDHEMRRVHAERIATGTTTLTGTPFLHPQLVPLDEVDLRTQEDHGQGSLFGGECEGMCGV